MPPKKGVASTLTRLPGIGARLAEKLGKLGIRRVEDLPFHLPARYEDRTRVLRIGELRPGISALVEGEITASEVTGGRRQRLVCRIAPIYRPSKAIESPQGIHCAINVRIGTRL